jgi:two-component system KDP operon response regulator KdpE
MSHERILVVDDEPQILRFLSLGLKAAGYAISTAATGGDSLKLIAQRAPDLIILDLGLPDMDGKDVISSVRAWSKVPIVVVSARGREAEKIAALDLGADDYINKPFGIGELMARLRTAFRHQAQQVGETTAVTVGDLIIDTLAHSAKRSGRPLRLTPKEFDILAMLTRNTGRVVTHRQLLTAVWGPSHGDDLQYLRVFIGQLRQKLEPDPERPSIILTEPGVGYRLNGEPD